MEDDWKQATDGDVIYDFDKERDLLMIIGGFKVNNKSKLKRYISLAYISISWVFLLYEVCMGFYSVILTMDDKNTMLETFHMAILPFYAISHFTNKHFSNFDPVLEFINKGFYTYNEKEVEAHYEIKKRHVQRIYFLNKWFKRSIIYSCTSFIVFNTIKKYIENMYRREPPKTPINPYLPLPFYTPFDTSSVLTFTFAYFTNMFTMFFVCMVSLCIEEIYISCNEQLKAQFAILNDSISKIEERAMQRFMKDKSGPKPNMDSLYQQKEFQDCLFKCLRENVLHHQALLRFIAVIKSYIEMTLLLVILIAALALALAVLVIAKSKFQREEILGVSTFLIMLLTELVFIFQFCFYGEEISNESNRIFFTLWSTPWYCFDKRVKSLLIIMMINLKTPIIFKSSFFNVSGSLASFSNIISTAYQVGNVVKNV